MPKGDKFSVGDVVFGKVKGYPPWPARIVAMQSKDRFKLYFYGTYETAGLKNEDIWIYNEQNKEKFAPKNMKRKGYSEGLNELENNPELAGIEDDVPMNSSVSTPTTANNTPTSKPKKSIAKDSPKTTPKPAKESGAAEGVVGARVAEKRKATAAGDSATSTPTQSSKVQKKAFTDDVKTSKSSKSDDSQSEDERGSVTSRSGRVIKSKNLAINDTKEDTPAATASPSTPVSSGRRNKGAAEGKENSSPVKNKAVDKAGSTPEQEKAGKLEKNKDRLRWLKMEQRVVELDIAVKSSLHIDKPSAERCITALEQLNELPIVPFMLKKQPDIVTTIRRLRKYIGPKGFSSWTDKEAKKKMEKNIDTIQKKADQIYNKFKSYFAYQGEKPFSAMFEQELEHFKQVTKDLDEQKVLCMIVDPTK